MATPPRRSRRRRQPMTSKVGVPADAFGGDTFDPTENVKALNEASNLRQDDLRAAYDRLVQEQIKANRELSDIKFAWAKEIALAEARRVDDIAELRADYAAQLSAKESDRIDAIRAVDVGAVQIAQERANAQATVLANTGAASAETLRSLVATTAAATASAQAQVLTPLDTRLRTLEQAQSVGQGRSALADPAFAELLNEVKNLRSSGSERTGAVSQNALLMAIGGFAIAVVLGYFAISRQSAAPVYAPPPGYVLAPAATK